MKERDLILDFTHVYDPSDPLISQMTYLDMSDIPSTKMYVSPEAKDEIRRRLRPYGFSGIHFIDSGDYHYITELFVERVKEPFSLVLFDYHNDMQEPMIHDLTSCGSWAGEVLLHHPYLRQLVLIGPSQKHIDEIALSSSKLLAISLQELEEKEADEKMRRIDTTVPGYLSIDKDVLSKAGAVTNWSQGRMSVSMLEKILKLILIEMRVIGVDITGENVRDVPLPEYQEATRINRHTNDELYLFIRKMLAFKKSEEELFKGINDGR